MKFQNKDDVRSMFSIFSQHSLKGPIELDVSLVRSFQDIWESLIGPGAANISEIAWLYQMKI